MKKIILAAVALLLCISAGAQKKAQHFKYLTQAFDELMKPFKEEFDAQRALDTLVRTSGPYEIRLGEGVDGYKNTPFLWDGSAGKYILAAPPTEKEMKKFRKQRSDLRVPAGTLHPRRMFFLDSKKGPMAGCPDSLSGCLWMDGIRYQSYNHNKKKTYETRICGIYRIEGGQLKQVVSLDHLSTVFNFYISEHHYQGDGLYARMDLVKPLRGTEYILCKSSYIETPKYTFQSGGDFTQRWSYTLYDWNWKELGTYGHMIRRDGRYWLEKDKVWSLTDLQLKPVELPYDKIGPVEDAYYDPAATLVCKDGKWGLLDTHDRVLIPCVYPKVSGDVYTGIRGAYQIFPQICYSHWYIDTLIEYLPKGEFEKQADYQARMASPELQARYLEKQLGPLQEAYIKWTKLEVAIYGQYDSERECFTIVPKATIPHPSNPDGVFVPIFWHAFELPVPLAEAPAFKEAFNDIKKEAVLAAKLSVRGEVVDIDEITFTLPDGHTYRYVNPAI